MNNKVAIYVRVSTKHQKPESQIEPCKNFCERKNYEVQDIFVDKARSAYKNVKRPGYEKVMKLVKGRKIEHVVVWSIDRFTRRGPEEFRNTIQYMTFYNVKFHSVKEDWIETINTDNTIGKIMRDFTLSILSWMAESESQRRSERIHASEKYQKAKDKGLVGRSTLPDEIVQKVISKLKQGKSYRQIRSEVTYKAKYGKVKNISIGKVSEIAKSIKETKP